MPELMFGSGSRSFHAHSELQFPKWGPLSLLIGCGRELRRAVKDGGDHCSDVLKPPPRTWWSPQHLLVLTEWILGE